MPYLYGSWDCTGASHSDEDSPLSRRRLASTAAPYQPMAEIGPASQVWTGPAESNALQGLATDPYRSLAEHGLASQVWTGPAESNAIQGRSDLFSQSHHETQPPEQDDLVRRLVDQYLGMMSNGLASDLHLDSVQAGATVNVGASNRLDVTCVPSGVSAASVLSTASASSLQRKGPDGETQVGSDNSEDRVELATDSTFHTEVNAEHEWARLFEDASHMPDGSAGYWWWRQGWPEVAALQPAIQPTCLTQTGDFSNVDTWT